MGWTILGLFQSWKAADSYVQLNIIWKNRGGLSSKFHGERRIWFSLSSRNPLLHLPKDQDDGTPDTGFWARAVGDWLTDAPKEPGDAKQIQHMTPMHDNRIKTPQSIRLDSCWYPLVPDMFSEANMSAYRI